MELVIPAEEHLDGYVAALRQRWSPNTMRPEAADDELAAIADDAEAFLRHKTDKAAVGPPIVQADGSQTPRLPGFSKWMWDGEFCGSINLRWQPGTTDLPRHVLGHIGYTVVPWKRGRGYATRALELLLPEAAAEGLDHVELTTEVGNPASRRVIEANDGVLIEEFDLDPDQGGDRGLRYRIHL